MLYIGYKYINNKCVLGVNVKSYRDVYLVKI